MTGVRTGLILSDRKQKRQKGPGYRRQLPDRHKEAQSYKTYYKIDWRSTQSSKIRHLSWENSRSHFECFPLQGVPMEAKLKLFAHTWVGNINDRWAIMSLGRTSVDIQGASTFQSLSANQAPGHDQGSDSKTSCYSSSESTTSLQDRNRGRLPGGFCVLIRGVESKY